MSDNVKQDNTALPSSIKQAIVDALLQTEAMRLYSVYGGCLSKESLNDVFGEIAKSYDASSDQPQVFEKLLMSDFGFELSRLGGRFSDDDELGQFLLELGVYEGNYTCFEIDGEEHTLDYLPSDDVAFMLDVTIENAKKLVTIDLTYGEWSAVAGGCSSNSAPSCIFDGEHTDLDDIEETDENLEIIEDAECRASAHARAVVQSEDASQSFE